jgi:protein ImuB
MLWACLHFPELPLDAVRPADCARDSAAALMDGPLRHPRIVLANAAARAAGVKPGQSLAAARALLPQLLAWRRDPGAEQQWLTTFADWAYRYSAEVSLAPPRALLLEVGASLRLFEGWETLERRLRCDLAQFGCSYRLVAAPVAAGARVLAVVADGIALSNTQQMIHALGDISVSHCGLEKKTSSILLATGLRRLKQVFALPRAELTRRIGPEALLYLDRMRGLVAEAWLAHHPAPRYLRRLEFDYRIDTVQGLLFPLQRLLRELSVFLIARDGGVQSFDLLLEHERGANTRLTVGLLVAQRDPASLLELARSRLERIELVAPVYALNLIAENLPSLRPVHADLFESNPKETLNWPMLVERARARLGDEAIRSVAAVADHRPAYAWRHQTLEKTEPAAPRPSCRTSARDASTRVLPTGRRPLWLLPKPIPLRQEPKRIISGPERIESGWWDVDQRHDYYVIETRDGRQAWAFVAVGATANWMLHGWFA